MTGQRFWCSLALLPIAWSQRVEFAHGVASGDVSPSSAVIWTRASRDATLTYEVSGTPGFEAILFSGVSVVSAESGYTAKVLLSGLTAGRTYYYRWSAGGSTSMVGTLRTPPLPWESATVRFVFSGDSDGTLVNGAPAHGGFDLLDAARQENPDFFLYVGDTIYADSEHRRGGPARTLHEFREAYRVNREVPALQRLMAGVSTYAMWDDHEIHDGWAGATVDRLLFAGARQAFLEHMPLRPRPLAAEEGCAGPPLYRSFLWGTELHVILLDTRTCRSASAAPACTSAERGLDYAPMLMSVFRAAAGLPLSPPAGCRDAILDPSRTMLGAAQKRWLMQTLQYSPARFKLIVTSVPMFSFYGLPYDRWEGYAPERAELLAFLHDRRIANVLFLTTDLHANLIAPVALDPQQDRTPLFHEIVAGPIATLPLEPDVGRNDPEGVESLNTVFDLVRVECRHLNTYAYGLVEADAATRRLRVSLRGADGQVLRDQRGAAKGCEKTFE